MEVDEYVEKIEISRKGLEITLINGVSKHISDKLDVWQLLTEIERIKKYE